MQKVHIPGVLNTMRSAPHSLAESIVLLQGGRVRADGGGEKLTRQQPAHDLFAQDGIHTLPHGRRRVQHQQHQQIHYQQIRLRAVQLDIDRPYAVSGLYHMRDLLPLTLLAPAQAGRG